MWISFGDFSTFFGSKRKFYSQGSSAAVLVMNVALSPQMRNSLFNTEQPKAFGLFDVKALPIVTNGKDEPLWFLLDIDSYGRGIRMCGTIVQGFLHHAIDACLVLVRKIVGNEICPYGYIHARLPGHFTGLPLQSRDQPKIIQHRWPQQQRHVAHCPYCVLDKVLDRLDVF